MKFEYLQEFLALAKTQNYSIAAEDLFISASSLSRHILLLEKELGVELFIRYPRTVTLSKYGELFYPYAETLLGTMEDFEKALAEQTKNTFPTLSIGFSRSAINYGIMQKLISFKHSHPSIRFNFSEAAPTQLLQMLRNRECDYIISYRYAFHNNSDYRAYTLIQDRLAVAVSVINPISQKPSLTLPDLKGQSFLVHDQSSPTYSYYRQLLLNAGIDPNTSIQIESTEFIMDLVSYGIGIALVGQKRYENLLPANVTLIPLEPEIPRQLVLTFKNRQLSKAEEYFFQYIQSIKF